MVEIAAESRISRVEVYARGAQVTRRARVAAPAGEVEVVLGKVTALAMPGSLRAEVDGGRQVIALRSSLVVPAAPSTPGPLLARVHELSRRVERLAGEQQALATRRQALLGVSWQPAFDGRDRRLEPSRRAADALAVSGMCAAIATGLEVGVEALEDQLGEARRALEAARLAAAQATTEEREGAGLPTREVRVRLSEGADAELELRFTYVIHAARWWPAYAARLADAGARAELELAAYVAQASGEDWKGVELALSTADLAADVRLPELASLRLSRRQAPPRRGYRPPPPGLDAMFEGYEHFAALEAAGRPRGGPPPAARRPHIGSAAGAGAPSPKKATAKLADMVLREEAEAPEEVHFSVGGPPPPAPYGAPPPAPMPAASADTMISMPPPPQLMRARAGGPPPPAPPMMQAFGGAPGGGGAPSASAPAPIAFGAAASAAIEPADAWLDFDGLELASGDEGGARGRLRKVPPPSGGLVRGAAAQQIESLAAPARAIDPRVSRGMFDHRYEAGAALDVPSDCRAHRLPLVRAEAPAKPRFVTVPREVAEVYREVVLENPFGTPLLPGPCEVFVEGVLLTTALLAEVGKGGTIALGLGVEERLRVARNARVEEQSAGLLGGSTTVDHRVSIELRSSLGAPVTVEVLDRVPVSDDDDIEISASSKPGAEPYERVERGAPLRGGLRWRVPLAAGGKATVEHSYRVRLSAKNELAGGNRRE